MRLVASLRVSTARQVDGLGLDVQELAIRMWAKANGHRIVEVFTDAGLSGSNGLDTRVALADALAAIRDRQADGLIVARLDQLARDLVLQEQLLAEVRRMGGTVCSAAGGEDAYLADDAADPSRKLIRQILGSAAEYERAMIGLRLRAGRAHKAKRGGFAYGSPRYGTRAEGKQLVVDQDEAATVKRIRQLHAAGKSLREIAATLTAEGHRPKRAERWHPQSLARIVARL